MPGERLVVDEYRCVDSDSNILKEQTGKVTVTYTARLIRHFPLKPAAISVDLWLI